MNYLKDIINLLFPKYNVLQSINKMMIKTIISNYFISKINAHFQLTNLLKYDDIVLIINFKEDKYGR